MWHESLPFPSRAPGLRLDLVLPDTRIGFGPLSLDPLAQLLGAPLDVLLQPILAGGPLPRLTPRAERLLVYPLGLPSGQGLSVSLGSFGELGFFNDNGLLRLILPASAASWAVHQLGNLLVAGPAASMSAQGTVPVAVIWLRLIPGTRFSLPVPAFGELAFEVPHAH